MQDIRKKFPDARISFPEAATKSDVVNIRGPKDQVDAVYAQLKKKNSELIASNYHTDVQIFKKFHKNIIGRGGATIKKVTKLHLSPSRALNGLRMVIFYDSK